MKLLLIFAGLFAISLAIGPQQDADVVFPPTTPNAEVWRDHLQKIDSEKLLSDGVPERYHYLYMIDAGVSDADIQKAMPFTKIKLSRSRCLGFCPAHEVGFSSTGEASYNGVAHTKKLGEHNAAITPYEFGRICWAIERLKLTDPQPEPRGKISDTSVTKLILTLQSGKVVEVTNHGYPSSIELLLVSTLIDKTTETKKWESLAKNRGITK